MEKEKSIGIESRAAVAGRTDLSTKLFEIYRKSYKTKNSVEKGESQMK